jgi:hypothetical protein
VDELKPCPFCGNTDVRLDCDEEDFYAVLCDLGRCAGNSGRFGSPESAISCWNTRTSPSVSPWRSLSDDPPTHDTYAIVRGKEPWTYPYDAYTRGNWLYVDRLLHSPHARSTLTELREFGFTEWMAVPQ